MPLDKENMARTPCLHPDVDLLCKLGSALIHASEYLSPHGHEVDKTAFFATINDEQVLEWIKQMSAMSLLPVKRR